MRDADTSWRRVRRDPRLIRAVAASTVLIGVVYLVWRAGWTLNLDAWWLSLPFLLVEAHTVLGIGLFTLSLWDVGDPPTARRAARAWRVAVVIPTYNEPPEVLLPTIAAAVALAPAHETWVLDDGRRPEVSELARRLGARYLTRSSNEYAKAGNLNHALSVIDVEVVAVLDADHVPLPGFLTDTLGYFDDETIAVVQTPQDFYNDDSFEHEQRSGRDDYTEQGVFYRAIGPGKNRWGGAFWCGTCALVRVAALRGVGGVAVETVTEDIHTTIRMQRAGWKTVYHNEVMARGLAASDATAYMQQRARWATGAMQVLRRERPFTRPGLTFGQRLAYATTLIAWFDTWRTLAYQVIPIVVIATGVMPVDAPLAVFGPIAIGVFVLQMLSLRLLARGYYPPRLSLIFEMLRLPAVLPATLAVFNPQRSRPFRVTPKGRTADGRERGGVPLLYRVLLAAGGLVMVWSAATFAGLTPVRYAHPDAVLGAAAFLIANELLVLAAIRRIRLPRYAGERRAGFRFPTQLWGVINAHRCRVADLSMTGARITLTAAAAAASEPRVSRLEIAGPSGSITLACRIRRLDGGELGVEFTPGQYEQRAKLALALFQHGAVAVDERQAA
jgi:cellulose synthase (UDP-forming)